MLHTDKIYMLNKHPLLRFFLFFLALGVTLGGCGEAAAQLPPPANVQCSVPCQRLIQTQHLTSTWLIPCRKINQENYLSDQEIIPRKLYACWFRGLAIFLVQRDPESCSFGKERKKDKVSYFTEENTGCECVNFTRHGVKSALPLVSCTRGNSNQAAGWNMNKHEWSAVELHLGNTYLVWVDQWCYDWVKQIMH